MQVLSIRFRTQKSPEEAEAMSAGSLQIFEKLRGLVQKYYVRGRNTDEIGGIYVWESPEHLQAYLAGPIVAAMPQRFAMPTPPRLEIFDLDWHAQPSTGFTSDPTGWAINFTHFTSGLSPEALRKKSHGFVSYYSTMPGLAHAYGVSNPESRRSGGIYVWESERHQDAGLSEPEVEYLRREFGSAGPIEIEALRISRVLR